MLRSCCWNKFFVVWFVFIFLCIIILQLLFFPWAHTYMINTIFLVAHITFSIIMRFYIARCASQFAVIIWYFLTIQRCFAFLLENTNKNVYTSLYYISIAHTSFTSFTHEQWYFHAISTMKIIKICLPLWYNTHQFLGLFWSVSWRFSFTSHFLRHLLLPLYCGMVLLNGWERNSNIAMPPWQWFFCFTFSWIWILLTSTFIVLCKVIH